MKFWFSLLFILSQPLTAQVYDEVRNFTKAGIAAYNQRKLVEAKQFFGAALDIDSTWAPAVLHYGQVYADILSTEVHLRTTVRQIGFEKYEKAEAELDDAEGIYPSHPRIPELRELLRKKREDNTKEILAKLPEGKRKEYEDAMAKAREAMDQAKYPEAMHHYSLALKIAPDSVDAKIGYAEAERLMKQEGGGQKTALLFRQAEKQEKDRRFAQAIGTYDQILRVEPNNEQATTRKAQLIDFMLQQLNATERKLLAKEYLKSGNEAFVKTDYSFAIEQYRVGQALDPKLTDWDALIRKAQAAKKQQEENAFADRLRELERRYQSAMLQMLLENFPAAIEDLEVVIQIATQFKQDKTREHAESLLQKAKEAMLRQDDEFVGRDSPYYNFVQSLTSLGVASYKKDDCDSVLKHFGAIIEVFPKNRISNQHMFACTIRLNPERKDAILRDLVDSIYRIKDNNAFEARRYLEILKFVDPQNARIPELERELAEKTQVLKKAIQPQEFLDALYKKALVLSQSDPEGALVILRQLLEDDPQNVKARALYARIEGRLNRARWAESDTPIAPNALRAYADGIVFYNTGQIIEAKNAFALALNLAPNFDRASVALKKCDAYSKGAKF